MSLHHQYQVLFPNRHIKGQETNELFVQNSGQIAMPQSLYSVHSNSCFRRSSLLDPELTLAVLEDVKELLLKQQNSVDL